MLPHLFVFHGVCLRWKLSLMIILQLFLLKVERGRSCLISYLKLFLLVNRGVFHLFYLYFLHILILTLMNGLQLVILFLLILEVFSLKLQLVMRGIELVLLFFYQILLILKTFQIAGNFCLRERRILVSFVLGLIE